MTYTLTIADSRLSIIDGREYDSHDAAAAAVRAILPDAVGFYCDDGCTLFYACQADCDLDEFGGHPEAAIAKVW